ncbi:MAG: DNA polymerase III subunit gamma/tau, partial [Bacteroidota bacterium]|nr:DNA polymerase III subunit gamma/tau [Bacteroidota bacterium]
AKETDAGFLISALNVLSESDLQYKAARNKRLHVELALIKLSYLGQALRLQDTGTDDKKKGVELVKPVAYRSLHPLEIREKKLTTGPGNTLGEKPLLMMPAGETQPGARLIIEEVAEQKPPKQATSLPVKTSSPFAPSTSLGVLSKIRQQVLSRNHSDATDLPKPLEPELLQLTWNRFTAELKENKNSSAQSFDGAVLKILDDQTFEILTNNNLEQRFIEQEKRNLSDLLQQVFNNKNLSFSISIRENANQHIHLERTLSKREQFQQMAEQYPLLKELKEKLKLELDY